ncbi:MAG: hypothetical protein Rubg2KO_01280 [Rubricoccaceae bacterium]
MTSYRQGDAGEAAVLAHFIQQGYSCYTSFGGHGAFDMVLHREDTGLKTVEVKSTSQRAASGNYIVELKRIRTNGSGHTLRRFDASGVDYVAVWIQPENRVVVLAAADLDGVCAKTIS